MAPRSLCVAIATILLLSLNCSTSSATNTTIEHSNVITTDPGTAAPSTSTKHPNAIEENPPTNISQGGTTHAPIDSHGSTSAPNDSHSISGGSTSSHDTATHGETGKGHYGGSSHGSNTIQLVPVKFDHVKYPLVFTLVVMVCSFSKLFFHYSHFLSSKVPESCVLITLGVGVGAILNFTGVSETITLFSPNEFFLYLLPPIVLEAAFCLHDRTFADNVGGVLLFAVVGTVMNCFAIGFSLFGLYKAGAMEEINCTFVQIMIFSALIVAVDPVAVLAVFQEVGVNNTLYFLVFGESLLNDGVTVVLYNVIQTYNRMDTVEVGHLFLGVVKFLIVCCGGTLLGIFMALLSAFVTRFTNDVKVIEPLMIFGFAYLSYILSELFEFSGIISMTACGIVQVHYAFHNITSKSRITVKFIAKVMANAAEIVIFMFLGIVTIKPDHDWKTGFTLWTALLCIVWRFIFTYSMSIAVNYFSNSRVRKIKADEMFMISYGGLRGAVCFSLVALIDANEIPMKNMFVTTSLFIIFQTVFVQGGTIKGLVKKLRITLAETGKDMNLNEELSSHVFDHVMAGIEEIVGYTTGSYQLKEKLYRMDDNFVKPKLLKNATKSDLTDISNYYEKLVMKEHFKNLQLGGAKGLPRVKTEIRALDSELALDQLVSGVDERQANGSHGAHDHRRDDSDHRMHLRVHDKNIVHDHKNQLVNNLRKKHRKNNQLTAIKMRRDEEEVAKIEEDEPTTITIQETLASRASQVQFQLYDTVHDENEGEPHENGKVTFQL